MFNQYCNEFSTVSWEFWFMSMDQLKEIPYDTVPASPEDINAKMDMFNFLTGDGQ